MKGTRTVFIVILVIAIMLTAVGCAQPQPAAEEPAAEEPAAEEPAAEEPAAEEPAGARTFGITFQTLDNQHWLRWEKGLKEVIEGNGDTLVVTNATYDSGKQITQVEDMIAQGCEVIFIVPVDSQAIDAAIESCYEADVPVICCDIAAANDEHVAATIATDNYSAGEILGQAMVEVTGGEGVVGMYTFDPAEAGRLRRVAFEDVLEGTDLNIVNSQEGMPSTEEAYPVAENMFTANPDITDVFCVNDLAAFGFVSAAESQGIEGIRIYGVDGNPEAAKMILEGKMVGTSAQFPDKMGILAAETAYKILAGEEVEKLQLVPAEWIDISNAEEYLELVGE